MKKELSAGGIIERDRKVVMILMNTLNGRKVWTFPKGHIEKGEDLKATALREVFEETGIKCEIINDEPFYISHYFFHRDGETVEKKVFYFLMKPVEETNKILTPIEISDVKWVDLETSIKIAEYESDKIMIKKLLNYGGKDGV